MPALWCPDRAVIKSALGTAASANDLQSMRQRPGS
jgi:hypothetical protein